MTPLLEYALAIIGSGGLGAAITYIFTFKSKKKQIEAEAEHQVVTTEHEKLDLNQDRYDYLQTTCDKYIKDYYSLEQEFRQKLAGLVDQIDQLKLANAQTISDKCNEIAQLKSKITYLKGIRCYNFTCDRRIKENPDKND